MDNLNKYCIFTGRRLSRDDNLNSEELFLGSITTYQISGYIPLNAPLGASGYGVVFCINVERRHQIYIDMDLGLKTRVWYSDAISQWI